MDEMQMSETVERLSAAVTALESLVGTITAAGETVGPIVATVASAREEELATKLAEAQQMIAELRASSGRKTVVAAMVAKGEGVSDIAAVDAALTSLSVEQRIAVKAEMLRSGLLR